MNIDKELEVDLMQCDNLFQNVTCLLSQFEML